MKEREGILIALRNEKGNPKKDGTCRICYQYPLENENVSGNEDND